MLTAPLTGHLDAALTDFAKAYSQAGLVGDLVAPRVPVGRQQDKYWIFGREHQELTEQQLRATGAPAQRVRMSLSTGSYKCESHALAADIADEDRAGYTAGDLEQDATQEMMDKILLKREDELASILTAPAIITNNTTLAGGNQWSDYGNSTPLTDVETGKASIRKNAGVNPNAFIIPDPVFQKLINHPAVIDRFKYTKAGAVGAAELASVFGVDRVLLASAIKTTAGTSDFVWGKDAVLLYVSPAPSRKDISAIKTFVWQGAPGTIDGMGVVTGRNPDPTAKSDIVGVDWYYDHVVTAVEAVYLIKAAVA